MGRKRKQRQENQNESNRIESERLESNEQLDLYDDIDVSDVVRYEKKFKSNRENVIGRNAVVSVGSIKHFFCQRMGPLSMPLSICIMVMPVCRSPCNMAY